MLFFTSDQHFGHENIIKYCGRNGFKNAHVMDNTIIKRYNDSVSKEDTCIMLGDFTMSANHEMIESIVKKLNGRKILVLTSRARR